ncbi:MAG: HEAT repeat domain-containing protein [Oxalobacteraceae bacterium]
MTTAAWLFCAIVLVFDAGIFTLLAEAPPSVGYLLVFLIAHATECLLFSLALLRLLPEPYRKPAFVSVLFVFTTTFFVPVLGMIGFLACLVPALRRPCLTARFSEWKHPQVLSLPILPVEPRGMGGVSRAGELANVLQRDADPDKRCSALIATLSLKDQHAVPLLRMALKDPEDDVRLLAYNLLNRKEKAIEARISDRKAQLGSGARDQIFLQHKGLAHDYWALAHLGASGGSTLLVLCVHAHEHVQAALNYYPQDGGLQFLFGRILLIEMQLDAASDAFENARQAGIDARETEPFLAEIAFLRQQYSDVKTHLVRAGNSRSRLRLNKASTYWEGVNNVAARI